MIEALLVLKAIAAVTVICWSWQRPALLAALWLALSAFAHAIYPWRNDLGIFWYAAMLALDAGLLAYMAKRPVSPGFRIVLGWPLVWCCVVNIASMIEFHTVYDRIHLLYPWAIQAAGLVECFGLMTWAIATGSLTDDRPQRRA